MRRRAIAAAGTYASVALGFLGTIVAARIFSTETLGLYALVLAATGFLQALLDLTIEEALVKYGFRYVAREDWGRLRRLFRKTFVFKFAGALLGSLALLILAVFAPQIFGHPELRVPLAIAAAIPILQAPEGMAGVALMLRGRYDLRALFLAVSMGLRLAAIAIGAPHGLTATVTAMVVAQGLASAAIGLAGWLAFRRWPRGAVAPLGDDARDILRFIFVSSGATGAVSLRTTLAPLLLGIVSTATQVGYFTVAQRPQQTFNAAAAPIRLMLLTEHTHAWEHGRHEVVYAGIRRYTLSALIGSILLLPPLLVFMPDIIRWLFEAKNLGAVDAARIVTVAGAVQFLVGWSKTFPVTIGRPHLRIWTHGLETLVLLPLVCVLGYEWGATGAAVGVLASSVAFALAWGVLFRRIRREPLPPRNPEPVAA
jgi:O-antigen/teichoic acid export membrane protein